MIEHPFFMSPGIWLGQGQIAIEEIEGSIVFYIRWQIFEEEKETIKCLQEIELAGSSEKSLNTYRFSEIQENKFTLNLESEAFGHIGGMGQYSSQNIIWSLKGDAFEGMEQYELEVDGSYRMYAKYRAKEGAVSEIRAKFWKKVS